MEGEHADMSATRPTYVETTQRRYSLQMQHQRSGPDGRGGRKEAYMSEEQNQIVSSQFNLKYVCVCVCVCVCVYTHTFKEMQKVCLTTEKLYAKMFPKNIKNLYYQ